MKTTGFVLLLLGLLLSAAPAGAAGFQQAAAPDGDAPPLALAIWYPSNDPIAATPIGPFQQAVAAQGTILGQGLPLVIFSHGTGGSLANSSDSALALAEAGFVVVALTHTGDNYQDQNRSFTRQNFVDRPRHISRVIDFMLNGWSGRAAIDQQHIGLLGHSAGGTTSLIVLGGELDWRQVAGFCLDHPQDWGCDNARRHSQPDAATDLTDVAIAAADPRIKAAVLAAPALGTSFTPESLAGIRVPLMLWVAGSDAIVPDAGLLQAALPAGTDYRLVQGAGHFAFLTPCNALLAAHAPEICKDPAGFDRAAFLQDFHQAVIAFFGAHLKPESKGRAGIPPGD